MKLPATGLELESTSSWRQYDYHYILPGRQLAAGKHLFSYLQGSNPGLDCKTLFLHSYTLSGVKIPDP